MSSPGLRILNTSILFLILLFVTGIQTTLWFQFFGQFPPPHLWLIVIVYVILYRGARLSLFLTYLMGFSVLSLTATSMGMLFVNLLILYAIISTLKSRFYWGGVGYFSLMCLIASFLFHFVYLVTSMIFEHQMAEILFWSRLGQGLLTPVVAIAFYPILKRLDQWTLSEEPQMEVVGPDL